MQNDRWVETRRNLDLILARRGIVYTLGLLMGIVTRLSLDDYRLYKEIETRAERTKNDS